MRSLLTVLGIAGLVLVASCKRGVPVDLASERACKDRLMQIGIYFSLYESKFKDYPDKMSLLLRSDMATDSGLFICPAGSDRSPYACRKPAKGSTPGPEFVVAHDSKAHSDGFRHVVRNDGKVLKLDEAEFQKALLAK